MSIYSMVVSTIKNTNSIYTYIGNTRKQVGAVYTFVGGTRKKVWPDQNPTPSSVIEYTTAGTHTVTLEAGNYRIYISGAGGGAACSYKTGSNAGGALAGGGSGAYGYVELQLNVQETFTFVVGAGGTGSVGGATQYASDGTITTASSNLRGTFITLNAGTGGSAWWEDSRSGHHWQTAGTGGTYSTTLGTHYLNNGSSGSADASNATTKDWYGNGATNPSPYYGSGGTAHFYGPGSMSNIYANSGQSGWVKIEKL